MVINKEIAEYFLSDAKVFLERFELLRVKSAHIGWRSKLLIELLFSLECAMKAAVFIESLQDEQETYKKIRRASHNLGKLLQILSPQSKKAYKSSITVDLGKFKVDARYMLESTLAFTGDAGILDMSYYETIADPSWMNNAFDQVSAFVKYVDLLSPFVIKTTKFSQIDIKTERDKYVRIRKMVEEFGNK